MAKGKILLIVCTFVLVCSKKDKVGAQDISDLSYVPGELLVRFAPKDRGIQLNISEKHNILNSLGGATVKHEFKIVPGLSLIKLNDNQKVEDVLSYYNSKDGVLYAEPNYRLNYLNEPNDLYFWFQWGLHNIGQGIGSPTVYGKPDADIDAPEAWEIRTSVDPNIIIALIDSGVDYTHPDLADNMWINELEYYGDPNSDDDENGYVDDIHGYDFYNNDNNPYDDLGHGTLCAGIIGAVGNNNMGIAGVCWNVKIMGIKSVNKFGNISIWDAIDSIEYAILMKANVLSNSWGGYYNQPNQ